MSANRFFSICALACLSAPICVAQVPASAPKETTRAADPADPLTAKAKMAGQHAHRSLSIETKKFPSELAEVFSLPPRCDADGNFYIRTNPEGDEAIRELNPKGERVALFQAKSPDLKVNRPTSFSISPGGDVYQIVHVWDIPQYVFAYKPDGSVKSEIKLQTSFPFSAYLLAVFATATCWCPVWNTIMTAAIRFDGRSQAFSLPAEICVKSWFSKTIRRSTTWPPRETRKWHPSRIHLSTMLCRREPWRRRRMAMYTLCGDFPLLFFTQFQREGKW